MASITIRNLDEKVKSRLRVRAAKNGHSMEQEAREILSTAINGSTGKTLSIAEEMRRYIEPFGGIELKIPKRRVSRRPPPDLR